MTPEKLEKAKLLADKFIMDLKRSPAGFILEEYLYKNLIILLEGLEIKEESPKIDTHNLHLQLAVEVHTLHELFTMNSKMSEVVGCLKRATNIANQIIKETME